MIDFIKKYKPTKWWHYIIIGVILLLAYFLPSCRATWKSDGNILIETPSDKFKSLVLPRDTTIAITTGALIGTAALTGAYNVTGGLLGAYQNYKYSRKLMDRQQNYNVQNWNMQNEYNLPINEMQRYKDAGLNPNLIYGSQGGSNAGSISPVSQPSAPNVDLGKMDFIQYALANSQIEKNRAEGDAALKNADTNAQNADTNSFLALAKASNLSADTENKLISNEIQKATKQQQISIIGLKYDQDKVALADSLFRIRNILPEIARQYQLNNQEIEKKIDLLVEQKHYTRELAAQCVANSLFLAAKTAGQYIENGILNESAQSIIDTNMSKSINSILDGGLKAQELEQRADYTYNSTNQFHFGIPKIFDVKVNSRSLYETGKYMYRKFTSYF